MEVLRPPPEILDRIFGHHELGLDESSPFTPQWPLYPLLFVCKEWSVVAQRRLYSAVGLGDGWTSGGGGEKICEGFHKSVKANPHLAPIVRELRLGSNDSLNEREETFHHAHILRLCENVERVEIRGFNDTHREELKAALLQRDLVELTISRTGLNGSPPTSLPKDTSFCTPSELIEYISHCPRLRKLSTEGAFHESDDESLLPDPSAVKGRCPMLKEISIKQDWFTMKHIQIVSEMAPNVEKAYFDSKGIGTDVLESCVLSWSSTLVDLFVHAHDEISFAEETCKSVRALRILTVCSDTIPPDLLDNFLHLTVLFYVCETEHLEQLASVLQGSHALPSLSKLFLSYNSGVQSEHPLHMLLQGGALQVITEACKNRDIRIEFL